MIGAGGSVDALAREIALAFAQNKPRPFAAFRGAYRRPLSNRRKIKGHPIAADMRRVFAMDIAPDRTSSLAKMQRGLRIIERVKAAEAAVS